MPLKQKERLTKNKLLSAGLEPVTYYLEIQYCPLSAKSDSWESVAQYETNSVFCESVQNFLPNVIPIPKWLDMYYYNNNRNNERRKV